MLASYLPVLVFLVAAITVPVVGLLVGRLVRPNKPTPAKLSPYECGIEPETDARDRMSIRFYIIAILVVVFDGETIFLFPWAVVFNELGLLAFIEAFLFVLILLVGFIYLIQCY